jgi:hypothetical protein
MKNAARIMSTMIGLAGLTAWRKIGEYIHNFHYKTHGKSPTGRPRCSYSQLTMFSTTQIIHYQIIGLSVNKLERM